MTMNHGRVYEMRQGVPILWSHFSLWIAKLPSESGFIPVSTSFFRGADGEYVCRVELMWESDYKAQQAEFDAINDRRKS